jgi:hypothetical protein
MRVTEYRAPFERSPRRRYSASYIFAALTRGNCSVFIVRRESHILVKVE